MSDSIWPYAHLTQAGIRAGISASTAIVKGWRINGEGAWLYVVSNGQSLCHPHCYWWVEERHHKPMGQPNG